MSTEIRTIPAKTPEQIAEEIALACRFAPETLADIEQVALKAIEADREQCKSIKNWLDDAQDFSDDYIERITVTVTGTSEDFLTTIHEVDFQLTKKQMRAMFFAIAGTED